MSESFLSNPAQMPQRRIEHPVIPPTIVEKPALEPADSMEPQSRVLSEAALNRSIRRAFGGSVQVHLPRKVAKRNGFSTGRKLLDMSAPIQDS